MVDYVHYNIVTCKMIASQAVLLALGFASVGKSISCVKTNFTLLMRLYYSENIIVILFQYILVFSFSKIVEKKI